jgi:glycosyltransferase involved in cell wall biosynthesis
MAISSQVHENRLASFPVFLKSDQRKVAKMRLVLAIPTAGRPALLSEVLHDIARQTRLPDFVVVSVSGAEDVDERALEDLPFPCMVVTGQKGASVQRNRAIEMLGPEDVLLLLDDDFLMAPDYVAQTVQLFQDHPEVAVATGRVLADGISGPGYDYREGLARLQAGADAGAGGISRAASRPMAAWCGPRPCAAYIWGASRGARPGSSWAIRRSPIRPI